MNENLNMSVSEIIAKDGSKKVLIPMHVNGEGVDYWYIAGENCINGSGGDSDGWDNKSCRLYQDVLFSGAYEDFYGEEKRFRKGVYCSAVHG